MRRASCSSAGPSERGKGGCHAKLLVGVCLITVALCRSACSALLLLAPGGKGEARCHDAPRYQGDTHKQADAVMSACTYPTPSPTGPRAERATVQPVEVVLGSSMRLTFTPSTGELLLVINAKGLTLQLSTTRGALAPDGSQRCDKRPARVPGAPAASTPTAAAAAGGGGGGGGAHAGKTRTRVQPGRPSGGGDSAAAASSGSAAQPSASAAAAAAAGFSPGAVAAAAEAAEPPGPEELQALLARAKALMATSHPEEKVEEAQAAAAAAAAEEPPAAAVGEDMDEGRESPAQEVE